MGSTPSKDGVESTPTETDGVKTPIEEDSVDKTLQSIEKMLLDTVCLCDMLVDVTGRRVCVCVCGYESYVFLERLESRLV